MNVSVAIATLVTIAWGAGSGWVVSWLCHRWEDGEGDAEGTAQWVAASCPTCRYELSLADTRPDTMLRHRSCPHCARGLAWTWWLPPVLVTLCALATLMSLGVTWVTLAVMWLAPVLVLVAVVDLRTMLIPTRVVWPSTLVAGALMFVASAAYGATSSLVGAAVGAATYFVILAVVWFVYPAGMGLGDVRLAVLLGLYLGWFHFALPLFALTFACIIGVAVGLVARHRGEGNAFPFGPGMALGALCAVWFAGPLINSVGVG